MNIRDVSRHLSKRGIEELKILGRHLNFGQKSEICAKIKPELLVGTASKTWAFQMATINWPALSERDGVHMLNFWHDVGHDTFLRY